MFRNTISRTRSYIYGRVRMTVVFRNTNKWNKLLAFIALQFLEICLKQNIPLYVVFNWPNYGTRDLQKKFLHILILENDQSNAP